MGESIKINKIHISIKTLVGKDNPKDPWPKIPNFLKENWDPNSYNNPEIDWPQNCISCGSSKIEHIYSEKGGTFKEYIAHLNIPFTLISAQSAHKLYSLPLILYLCNPCYFKARKTVIINVFLFGLLGIFSILLMFLFSFYPLIISLIIFVFIAPFFFGLHFLYEKLRLDRVVLIFFFAVAGLIAIGNFVFTFNFYSSILHYFLTMLGFGLYIIAIFGIFYYLTRIRRECVTFYKCKFQKSSNEYKLTIKSSKYFLAFSEKNKEFFDNCIISYRI